MLFYIKNTFLCKKCCTHNSYYLQTLHFFLSALLRTFKQNYALNFTDIRLESRETYFAKNIHCLTFLQHKVLINNP